MTSMNTGGPAFPVVDLDITKEGMTLRDYFAAKAMQGLMASSVEATPAEFASRSYQVADAMLAAREAA